MTESCIPILQVEDDPVDVRALRRLFSKFDQSVSITVASDGVQALEILRKPRENDAPPPPYLIFLDLNMPRMNGFELLERLNEDDSMDENMICVLTSSEPDDGPINQYRHLVEDYLTKTKVDEDHSCLENVVFRFLDRMAC